MRTVTIHTKWRATQQVEVPDDYVFDGTLDEVWSDQVDPGGAYLADWEVAE